jgi:hypothetical protein
MLEQEHCLGHCKVELCFLSYVSLYLSFHYLSKTIPFPSLPLLQDHPKDVEFLNCPIRFYTKMESIFDHAMATGRFAVVSSESVAAMATGRFAVVLAKKTHTDIGCSSKAIELLSSAVGAKRKRGTFSEDEMLMLTNMSDVVNNVANALWETGPAHVDVDLCLVVTEMSGFIEEALIVAYIYLLDNKAQGRSFVGISDSHRNIWLRNYLAKNYYM